MFSVALVCVFVCLLVIYYSTSYERIVMKFYGGVRHGKRTMRLDFGSDLNHHADCPISNPAITQHIIRFSGF